MTDSDLYTVHSALYWKIWERLSKSEKYFLVMRKCLFAGNLIQITNTRNTGILKKYKRGRDTFLRIDIGCPHS